MADYLLVTDSLAPLSEAPSAAGALGLASALAARGHRVVALAQAAPEALAAQTGLARRLRPVAVTLGAGAEASRLEVPLYEGRPTASAAHVFVLGVAPRSTGHTAALLGAAVETMLADGVLRADVAIGWGEPSALALAALGNARRLLVLPDGRLAGPLTVADLALVNARAALDVDGEDSLIGRAALATDAIAVPSPSAASVVCKNPSVAARPSDQPLAVVRLGCDDPPHDPASDPALGHHFSASAPAGKAEARKALARRLTLAVGPRTLLVVAPPLVPGPGAEALLAALAQLAGLDVAVALPVGGDRTLAERARVLAIQNPGRMALVTETTPALARELYAGADAAIFVTAEDLTGRAAGLALRYGALPIAPEAGAFGDFLVDYDARSATGAALLYAPQDSFELTGAIRRAIALRTDRERWDALLVALLSSAPSWAATAARLESLADEAVRAVPVALIA